MELSMSVQNVQIIRSKEWREYHKGACKITPTTKAKAQGILEPENVPGSALVCQKHWTPLVSESRPFWLSLTWVGQGGCPIVHWGHLKASFAVSGCNYHLFSLPAHSQDSMQILLIYTPECQSRLSPLSPTTIFTWGTHITACLGQTLESGYWHLRKDFL